MGHFSKTTAGRWDGDIDKDIIATVAEVKLDARGTGIGWSLVLTQPQPNI